MRRTGNHGIVDADGNLRSLASVELSDSRILYITPHGFFRQKNWILHLHLSYLSAWRLIQLVQKLSLPPMNNTSKENDLYAGGEDECK
jgi:hypothetical protein